MRSVKLNKTPQISDFQSQNIIEMCEFYQNNIIPSESALFSFAQTFLKQTPTFLNSNEFILSAFILTYKPSFPQSSIELAQNLLESLATALFQNLQVSDPENFATFMQTLNIQQFNIISGSIKFFTCFYTPVFQYFVQFEECQEQISSVLKTSKIDLNSLIQLPFLPYEAYFESANFCFQSDSEELHQLADKIDCSSLCEFRNSTPAFLLFINCYVHSRMNTRSFETKQGIKIIKSMIQSIDSKKQKIGFEGLLEISRKSNYFSLKIGIESIIHSDVAEQIADVLGGEFLVQWEELKQE
ncbi:hypothetical protein SS50377_24321 [Spironucleus salmonicida]|uniref:Uncharacterized protein n=1 Tax=Spironucleus salmonicida TaxID=348837 RepID=V6LN55_9EUKA|nr:hypothetical protein SS50377_24321 [Spironucleus salmonicida]|eukprot:EST46127.1 Hypothetical protein SS50377_14122 [Spironucleus salmonicida]